MWRCPHCETPQAEAARCWVCRRSSTACGSCRHFRRAVAGGLGYCGLDRTRAPLAGDEIRACWEARTAEPEPVVAAVAGGNRTPPPDRSLVLLGERRAPLEFVEVGARPERAPRPARRPKADVIASEASEAPPSLPGAVTKGAPDEPRWNLWGDLDA